MGGVYGDRPLCQTHSKPMGYGTVYELVAQAGGYQEKVVWSFDGMDGLECLVLPAVA